MADSLSQRSFSKYLHKDTTAAQMRERATDVVRSVSQTVRSEEEEFPAKVKISDPLDYEKELLNVKDEIKRFQNGKLIKMVLYPVDDISVEQEIRLRRTERSTVPPGAHQQAENLFTKQCLSLYSSHWHRLKFNYARYTAGVTTLLSSTSSRDLQTLQFEIDEVEEEARKRALDIAAQREKVQGKRGFLQKGPFPGEGAFAQKWKRRWCVLQHGTQDGNFYLELYRDEKTATPSKTINLGTCENVEKNPKIKPHGFDLLTGDEKLVYPFAADSEEELEEWMEALSKALGIEDEAVAGDAQFATWNRTDTLRDPHRTTLHSEHLKHTASTDKENAKSRKKKRHRLFAVYPGLIGQKGDESNDMEEAPVPGEHLGKRRILVKCKSLMLRLTARNSTGQLTHVEPFFVSLALYDANKGLKVSEDFHVDLNDFHLRSLLEKQSAKSLNSNNSGSTQQIGASGLEPKDQWPTLSQQVLFSVTFPHPDIYLVARIEKVLQSGISACAEPYVRMGDNTKAAQKLCKQMTALCNILGEYRMPFAWAARPMFQPDGALDTTSEFSPLYRQDRERLTDSDLLKVLSDYKNVSRMKLVTIPGTLAVDVQSYDEPRTGVLNPSLVKVLPFSSGSAGVAGENLVREAQEFVPVEAFHPHTSYHIHLTYTHHLYLYPLSLKYDTQRNFAKARNIACCIQVKERDDPNAQPLPLIYGRALGPSFQDRVFTTVLHHCTTPSFYQEVKVELPVNIHSKHHVLFTFLHISCELQRASKKDCVASVVGYSWLPLLDKDGRLVSEVQSLSVAASLRDGYLTCGTTRVGTSHHLPFVDGGKPLFRVDVRANSTIYPKEECLHQFFEVASKLTSEERLTSSLMEEAIKGMYELGLPSLVGHLPVIFNQLLALLVDLGREHEGVKPQIIKLLLHYLHLLEEAKLTEVVQSYLQYVFQTCVNKANERTLHDELAKQLALYLKQQDSNSISLLLDHLWLFFEMILKSVAHYLKEVGKLDKLSSRKKCPYSDDLYWNLQTVIYNLHTCVIMKLEEGRRANKSVALFVRRCFTVMDRGQVFKMMAKYLETFKVRDNKLVFEMKFEFLRIVCDCEHFIPLNFPWTEVKDVTQCAMKLTEEYCERHFPLGVLLREVDSALQFEPLAQRKLAVRVLCSLVAKLDMDDRYTDPAQKAVISALFLPLLTIALENVHRFNVGHHQQQATLSQSMKGELLYSSPLPQQSLTKRGSILGSSISHLQSGNTPEKEKEARDGNASSPPATINRVSMISVNTAANRAASKRTTLLPISETTAQPTPSSTSGSQLKEATSTSNAAMATGMSPSSTLLPGMTPVDIALQEWDRLSPEETKDLLSCVVFVLKNSREDVLLNWWRRCLGSLSGIPPIIWEKYMYPEILCFFELLSCCLHVFDYRGRLSISAEAHNCSTSRSLPRQANEASYRSPMPSSSASGGGAAKKRSEGMLKKNIVVLPEAPEGLDGGGDQPAMTEEKIQVIVSATANCAMEVSLVVLDILDLFGDSFKEKLQMEHGDNILMRKYFMLLVTLLQTNQSVEMLQHIFAFIRCFIHKFPETLYKGSSEFCSLLCYEVLQCCNSRLPAVRSEAATVLYLILKKNWEFFRGQGLVRSHVQSTIAVSVLVSQIRERSDNNLRRSLFVISNFPAQSDIVRAPEFSREVSELMKRLRTVLTSSAQMKEYHSDPEKLADLYYDLAQSYASSPELRKTWLRNMLQLHVSQGNFSEAAMCCLHMAGLVAEYLKLSGQQAAGCSAFLRISPNISKEESDIKQDIETGEEDHCYTKHDLVVELQSALDYLWEASRYEVMGEVGKLLLPFYEEEREYELMSAMFKKLHLAYDKVVDVMATRKRYLATYFKVVFFGKLFKDDDGVQYVYKEPKVTTLEEFSTRLQTLYRRRIGPENLVIIFTAKVDVEQLDADKAYIQIVYVEPYFTPEEETDRRTQFEHENNLSSFVYDTPFTKDGKVHGETTTQWMRKTVVTTENWFPFVKKRIRIIHEQSYELTPIQVGLEAIENKTKQLAAELGHSPPDLKKLHLILQGSISAQVHSGAQEYANAFLTEEEEERQPVKEVLLLKEAYRDFMLVCKDALELSRRLIFSNQQLYQEDLETKFASMQASLGPLIGLEPVDSISAMMSRSPELSLTPQRWSVASGNPYRLSSVVFNAISNTNVV